MKVLTAFEDDVRAYMHQVGYGPHKYYEDCQILIEECFSGKPMVFSEIRNFKLLQKLMPVFAEFHSRLQGIPRMNSKTLFAQSLDKGIMKRIKHHLEYCKKLHFSHFADLQAFERNEKEVIVLKKIIDFLSNTKLLEYTLEMDQTNSVFVMSHNDLNMNNILYDHSRETFKLIDFEYSCFSPFGYELANTILESCFEFNKAKNAYQINHSVFLDDSKLKNLLELYVEALDKEKMGIDPKDPRLDPVKLVADVKKFYTVVNNCWLIWCCLKVNDPLVEFDLASYSECRLEVGNHLENLYIPGYQGQKN